MGINKYTQDDDAASASEAEKSQDAHEWEFWSIYGFSEVYGPQADQKRQA